MQIHTERTAGRWRASAANAVAWSRSRRRAIALVWEMLARASR